MIARAAGLARLLGSLWLAGVLTGCAHSRPAASTRAFQFQSDTFAFTNRTVWEYQINPATGTTTHTRRQGPAGYSLHCFVVARSARQFFQHARFDPAQPEADEAVYRHLIRQVVSIDPTRELPEARKIVIPGFANLRGFSQKYEALLKAECGGAWQSYFQRGHWRMIFPFSRGHQLKTAERLLESLRQNRPPVVHVVTFPKLSINHAVLVFAAEETAEEIRFSAYDPNSVTMPLPLIFDRAERRFRLPATHYFAGGRVTAYQIYFRWDF